MAMVERYERELHRRGIAGFERRNDEGAQVCLVPVDVETDGGSDGDAENPPSYTYTARDLAGNTLGEEMSPVWGRSSGSFEPATHGTGYWDSDGSFVLYQVDEVEASVAACGEEES